MSSEYQSSFFIVPSRISRLPDITIACLRVYETIFQFWNHGRQCYLSNDAIMERAGITSTSTLSEAFMYLESKGELIRKMKGKKRYFIQPERIVEVDDMPVDNFDESSTKTSHGLGTPRARSRYAESDGLGTPRHNNKNINNKNIKREHARKRRVPLPDDFILDDQNKIRCGEKSIDISLFTIKFRLKNKGKTSDDWQNQARIWIETERPDGFMGKKIESHSNVMEYGPGHPTWESNQEWNRRMKEKSHGRDQSGAVSMLQN
jgi:hypothetical protein